MIKKDYAQIKETLYTETLENGLKVYLLPKNDFQKTYGLFTTDYGLYQFYENELFVFNDGSSDTKSRNVA